MNDGTLPVFLAEIFPTRVRYSGFAFSFNTANALFGGTAPFVATLLIKVTGSSLAPAWYLVAAALVAMGAMAPSPRDGPGAARRLTQPSCRRLSQLLQPRNHPAHPPITMNRKEPAP